MEGYLWFNSIEKRYECGSYIEYKAKSRRFSDKSDIVLLERTLSSIEKLKVRVDQLNQKFPQSKQGNELKL